MDLEKKKKDACRHGGPRSSSVAATAGVVGATTTGTTASVGGISSNPRLHQ